METGREEIDPFEGIDDPTLRVQMQHEMRAIEELVFVTKLSFVPSHKDKTEGFRSFRAFFAGGMTAVERGKSKQFNSRGSAQRCSPVYRNCENVWRIVMSFGALKLLPKKPPLMPNQQLLYIHLVCWRRCCCSNRTKNTHKPRKIAQKPLKIR